MEKQLEKGMVLQRLRVPKYLRGLLWTAPRPLFSPSAASTEVAEPMPRPPLKELHNPVTSHTILSNPDLFLIVTPVKIDILADLLQSHPNPAFVQSVCTGFREGFWPWADVTNEPGNITRDYSANYKPDPDELAFLQDYYIGEQQADRYSIAFGPNLLPGMVSEPAFAVPKPRSDKLRLVNHHSAGSFSLNDMIPKYDRSIRLDNLHDFGKILRSFHQLNGRGPRWIFKSDVAGAFRLLPMHPHWQIRQIVTLNDKQGVLRLVDRCCCFGSGGSPHIWCSFFGLVIWIAVIVKNITDLLHYMDDAFSFDDDPELGYYKPYDMRCPKKQVRLLQLWDELGIPHEKRKQEYGTSLDIIGLHVDPQAMTITMSDSRRADLIAEIDRFISDTRKPTLLSWQRLAGWIHWALNAYPLLRPALNPFHAKIAGKTHQHAPVPVNKDVKVSLIWLRDRLATIPGVAILDAELWDESQADLVIWCDACTGDKHRPAGLGFWSPALGQGFFGKGPSTFPPSMGEQGTIFFLEALCVLSALCWAVHLDPRPHRLLIYTDSMNTADMFATLRAESGYNDILMTAVEILLDTHISLRVFHVAGSDNVIADALSRSYFDVVNQLQPQLQLNQFQPPHLYAGEAQK